MKLILRTVKGKRSPTAADIDELVTRNGIYRTFLGAEAHTVGSHDFVELDGHYVTGTVGFGFGRVSSVLLLVVVSREDPEDVYYFSCSPKTMVFSDPRPECEDSRMLANQIHRSIRKCPTETTPDKIAAAVRPELEHIRANTDDSLQRIRNHGALHFGVSFVAMLLLVIAGMWGGGQLLTLVKEIKSDNIKSDDALRVEVKELRNKTHTLTLIAKDRDELAELLQSGQKKLQQQYEFTAAEVVELKVHVAEVDSRNQYQDRRIDEIGDKVNKMEATQKHYQPAIDGPPKNQTGGEVGKYAPRGDDMLECVWYAIRQIVCLAFVIWVVVSVIWGVAGFLAYRDDQNALLRRKLKTF